MLRKDRYIIKLVENFNNLIRVIKIGATLILIFLFTATGLCQENKNIYHQIDLLLQQKYKNQKLNGNVLVIRNDTVIYEQSFGYTDGSKSTKLNKNYKFQIGSVYKEFPAVAIMQLYEQHLIELDDKIQKYFPELPEWTNQISIKNLLQYSSGLPQVKWSKYRELNQYITTQDILNDLKGIKSLEFSPGSDYLYTNNSPFLLMQIVEKVSKQKFIEYAKKNLFADIKEVDVSIETKYPYTDKTNMAIPFDSQFVEDGYKNKILIFTMTAKGMCNWFNLLNSNKLISEKSKLFLTKSANIISDKRFLQSPLGIIIVNKDHITSPLKIVEHTHDGANQNFECIGRRFNKEGVTIIILTNQKNNNVYNISEDIYKIIRISK